METILVQGAMTSEIELIIKLLAENNKIDITEQNGYSFYETYLNSR